MTDLNSTIELSQSDLVFLHSPLNILAQFTLAVQERFSQQKLPWEYDDDENVTDIFIHTSYNSPQDTANAAPRVVIDRGTVVHERTVMGDLADSQPNMLTREEYYHYGMCTGDIRIQCVSETKGEATLLGDIVQTLIGMTRKELCKQFTLRNISQIALQPCRPYERDKEKWQASVQFRIEWEHRWVTFPIAPELKQASLYTDSQLDGLGYIKNFIIRDNDLPPL